MTPLERMARAACEADFRKTFPEILDWQRTVDRDWQCYLPQMRAALAAIEVPSEGMMEAAFGDCVPATRMFGSDVFTAMIRAALEEGP